MRALRACAAVLNRALQGTECLRPETVFPAIPEQKRGPCHAGDRHGAAGRGANSSCKCEPVLEAAIGTFETKIIPARNAAALNAKLADARQALTDHLEGTNVGEAAGTDRASLQSVINAAQAILDDAANRTQTQLDSAVARSGHVPQHPERRCFSMQSTRNELAPGDYWLWVLHGSDLIARLPFAIGRVSR